ncbi:winged helix-turn-helix domain-containing protein [Streptomyces sp. NPDC057694]|uniref:helix-turn-helix domain-containing protein n=1 Tax=Streptomyces sp. NPDC057694 TaxID=3346216 RepID=UPI0036C11E4E
MSNSTKKKGRRHRTVNRTPRPVGTVTAPRAGTTAPVTVPGQKGEPDLDRVLRKLGYGRLRVPAPAAPSEPAARRPAPRETAPHETAPRETAPLNKNARLTLEFLERADGGRTLEQVCDAVGWTPRTVARHLKTLADAGLAEQAEDGQWSATGTRSGANGERHLVS